MPGKEDLFVSMEYLPELNINQYTIECQGCLKGCVFHFRSPRKLSFAFVGSLAGGFSSPCRKLAKADATSDAPDGQLSLISAAGEE